MYVSKRKVTALLVTAAFAGSAATGASALAHGGNGARGHHGHDGRTVLRTTLAPSVPTDPPLFGVAPGALPWVIRAGRAELRRNGRLDITIRGLVIPTAPFTGTPGPVTTVDASLYCDDSSTAAGTTPTVPLSRQGNADIEAKLTLPSKCLAPALLIHPNGMSSSYIAASGFTG